MANYFINKVCIGYLIPYDYMIVLVSKFYVTSKIESHWQALIGSCVSYL